MGSAVTMGVESNKVPYHHKYTVTYGTSLYHQAPDSQQDGYRYTIYIYSDEICLHLELEISKISDCMPFLEIFPHSFGESTPSTVVPNHWHISLSYYSIVSIHLFHFPSPAILVIVKASGTSLYFKRSSLRTK